MATVRKRGNSYNVQVRRNGFEETKSFPISAFSASKDPDAAAKAAAELWGATTESNILAEKHQQIPDKTFGDLLIRYREEVTPTKRGERWESIRIAAFLRDPITNVNLRDLNSSHFAEWRNRRLKVISNNSVLREWNTMSNACKVARDEWKWMTTNPLKEVAKPEKPEPRDRVPTELELATMKHAAGYYEDKPIASKTEMAFVAFLFSSETALRAGELAALEFDEVFMDRGFLKVAGVKAGARKNKSAVRDVPLTTRAKEILRQIQMTHSEGPVFQISQTSLDALFRKVRDRAGVQDLHFHDSRHAAITMLSKHYDILALARIVGHKNVKELMTYYNPTIDDLVKHAP